MPSYADKSQAAGLPRCQVPSQHPAAGKQSLVEQIPAHVQARRAAEPDKHDEGRVHAAAAHGVATSRTSLPFADTIQRAFGRHDVSSVQTHTGPDAAASAQALGAEAYATGDHIVLGRGNDLHTVAHEAAHVVQQRGGVQWKGGVGEAGDAYERHADAIADRVAAGQSAEDLLDDGPERATPAIQRKESPGDAKLLEHQATFGDTNVEIPALEGALLATRQVASSTAFCRRSHSMLAWRSRRRWPNSSPQQSPMVPSTDRCRTTQRSPR